MKLSKKQTPKPEGELLSPLKGMPDYTHHLRAPGFDGPRPLLSFILRVLAGDRCLIDEHLTFFMVWFEFQCEGGLNPEINALERAIEDKSSIMSYAIDGMGETMWRLTDMWIDSGKSLMDPDVDSPADRNVEDVLPGQSWSLFEEIRGLLFARHPFYASQRRDGSLGIGDEVPRFSETHADRSREDRLKEYGAMFAAYWFVKLLDSADAGRIARCDSCKAYFSFERVRRSPTKRGVFCSRCRAVKGSKKRTEVSRAKRIDTAARAWCDWATKHEGTPEPQWIASQVNEAHQTSFGRRWVSQHMAQIQQRVERRKQDQIPHARAQREVSNRGRRIDS
jgi:hypothetical protein